jgi:hypothetical protein
MRLHGLSLSLALAFATTGCAKRVYSPPARPMPLEDARTVGAGKSSVAVEVTGADTLFGPSLVTVDLRGRYGVRADLELSAEAAAARVSDESAVGTEREIYAGRLGAKLAPEGNRWFALAAGAGAGYAPAGGPFASADLGAIVSYDNCYVIPTLAGTGFVSEPLSPRAIDLTQLGDDAPIFDTPQTTWGASVRVGVKIPLGHARCPDPARVALTAGIGATWLTDRDDSEQLTNVGFGLELGL